MNIISPTSKMAAEEGNDWQKTTHMGCVTARHKIIDKYLKLKTHEFKTEFPPPPVLEAMYKSTTKIKIIQKSYD